MATADLSYSFAGARTGFLLIHGLGGTPVELKYVAKGLARRGFTVGGGYGEWKPSTFRIGHMGEVQESDLAELLTVLDEELMTCTAS